MNIENPSEEMQLKAIKEEIIAYVNNPTEKVLSVIIDKMVKRNMIKNPKILYRLKDKKRIIDYIIKKYQLYLIDLLIENKIDADELFEYGNIKFV